MEWRERGIEMVYTDACNNRCCTCQYWKGERRYDARTKRVHYENSVSNLEPCAMNENAIEPKKCAETDFCDVLTCGVCDNADSSEGKNRKKEKTSLGKELRLVLGVGLAGFLVASVLFFICKKMYSPVPKAEPCFVKSEIDWDNDLKGVSLPVKGKYIDGLKFADDFLLCIAYPHSDNLGDRYFTRIKFLFKTKACRDKECFGVHLEAFFSPKIVPAENLVMGVKEVHAINLSFWDRDGKKSNVNVTELNSKLEEMLMELMIPFNNVEGISSSEKIKDEVIWVRSYGLEYMVTGR